MMDDLRERNFEDDICEWLCEHGGYTADQFVLALRHAHMSPVKAFRFKGVRKPGKDHRRLRLLRALHRFL